MVGLSWWCRLVLRQCLCHQSSICLASNLRIVMAVVIVWAAASTCLFTRCAVLLCSLASSSTHTSGGDHFAQLPQSYAFQNPLQYSQHIRVVVSPRYHRYNPFHIASFSSSVTITERLGKLHWLALTWSYWCDGGHGNCALKGIYLVRPNYVS